MFLIISLLNKMNKALNIIAKVVARRDKIELVKSELQKLVSATVEEKGCVTYGLHQDLDEPHVFMFYETWASYEDWEQHMESPNLDRYKKATENAIDELVLHKLMRV